MVDKITTVPKSRLGRRIGRLDDEDVVRLNRATLVFLGLATTRRRNEEVASPARASHSSSDPSGTPSNRNVER